MSPCIPRPFFRSLPRPLAAAALALAIGIASPAAAQTSDAPGVANAGHLDEAASGVTRLRDTGAAGTSRPVPDESPAAATAPYVPGEFELFVNRLVRQDVLDTPRSDRKIDVRATEPTQEETMIRRFGAELVTGLRGSPQDYAPQVPPDYLVSPGDQIALAMWGSVDANLHLTVDRAGRITIPRVGAVMVSGVRYADLPAVVRQQVGQVFRNFQLSISLEQLRSIRIYVTGFTPRPGSYAVSSLSTIVNALMRTGGPSAAGSFRDIRVYREGRLLTTFDLYDLLLRGDKSADRVLQAEDVIQIGPIGPQVALIGSVNKPAIFELKNAETVTDVLRMGAGFTAVADTGRLAVERLSDRESVRVRELKLPDDAGAHPASGDVLRAFSLVQVALPVQRQNKRVSIEGEVRSPGVYILAPGSTLNDALKAAGPFVLITSIS